MIVYVYTFPNGKKYVGQTIQTLEKRARKGRGYKLQPLVYDAIQKYGWDNIQKEIIECSSEEEMDKIEQKLIAKYKTQDRKFGYNLDSGGHKEKHHSEETKKKISNSIKGKNHPNYGKHRSEETKRKLSEWHTGTHLSEETKRKISESNKGKRGPWTGKHFLEKHKQHIGESVKGEKNGMYGKNHTKETKQKISEAKGIKVICLETKEVYPSAQAASKAIGLSISAVGQVICGKAKTSGGYHWMKLIDYENLYGEIKK